MTHDQILGGLNDRPLLPTILEAGTVKVKVEVLQGKLHSEASSFGL